MNQTSPVAHLEEIHLQDYLAVLMRRRKIFLVTFLAIFTGVALYTFLLPSMYESRATLFVNGDKAEVAKTGDLLINTGPPVDSEIEILKSRSNAERVVEKLHLNWRVDRRSEGVDCKPLEFSSTSKEPVYHVQLLGGGSYEVRDDDGNLVGTGTSGSLLRGKGFTLLLNDIKGEKGDSFRITLLPFDETVAGLRQRIKAVEVGKKTSVISVTYRDADPLVARDVVNTLVQAYLELGTAIKAQEATRTLGFVEEQLKAMGTKLEGAEKNLQSYKSASGVIQLDSEARNLIQSLTDVEKQKAEASLKRKQVEFALGSLKEARSRGGVYSPAVLRDDPLVAGMASQLAELEVQKRGLLSESTENHPTVKRVQAQIDELQRKLQATYQTSLEGMAKQEENISRDISRHDAQLKKLPVAERDLARLERLSKVNADIYTFLLQKHEEARIAKASTISNINVVDPAITPYRPVSPNKKMNLLLGVIVGLISGVGISFFRDYLDDTLKDPEQMRSVLAMPFLAMIPFISAKDGDAAMTSHNEPRSPASEAFRSLRTGLKFCALAKERNVTLVTSTLSGEGKSTVALNLAITLAHTGARVLIVDCDLRRSTLHEKFGMPKGKGLTELLLGEIGVAAAIKVSKVDGLDLLQAGYYPPNPAELLGSEAMALFIEEMRKTYSHIIIDAPPLLAVSDTLVLIPIADLLLLVLESGRVPARAALRMREMLVAAAAPVAGLVISEKSARSAGFGYGYGYRYGYQVEEEPKKSRWHWK